MCSVQLFPNNKTKFIYLPHQPGSHHLPTSPDHTIYPPSRITPFTYPTSPDHTIYLPHQPGSHHLPTSPDHTIYLPHQPGPHHLLTPPSWITDTRLIVTLSMSTAYSITSEAGVTRVTYTAIVRLLVAMETWILALWSHPLGVTLTERLFFCTATCPWCDNIRQ